MGSVWLTGQEAAQPPTATQRCPLAVISVVRQAGPSRVRACAQLPWRRASGGVDFRPCATIDLLLAATDGITSCRATTSHEGFRREEIVERRGEAEWSCEQTSGDEIGAHPPMSTPFLWVRALVRAAVAVRMLFGDIKSPARPAVGGCSSTLLRRASLLTFTLPGKAPCYAIVNTYIVIYYQVGR